MIQSKDYKTRTQFIPRQNVSAGNDWPMALDIGYSAVKGMSPNKVFCFPSFARPVKGAALNLCAPPPDAIQYKDGETGEIWDVGESAYRSIASNDTNDSVRSLYGRNRYDSPMFLVLARTGLGIGMMPNEFGTLTGSGSIYLETGLPPAYLKTDTAFLKDVLARRHKFSLRVGDGVWQDFDLDIPRDNIRAMGQPMGSLLSAGMDNEARMVPEASQYFSSNLLVFDAGFGTTDTFNVRNQRVEGSESFDDLGMKAILMETAAQIFSKYGVDVPIHAMQKCLQDGTVQLFDRRAMTTKHEPISDLLEAATQKVCMEAIERIKTMYELQDYQYLLVTGGTGAAWLDLIREHFAGMDTLSVITGNQNDALSHVYSNVRGYYLFLVGRLRQQSKRKG